MVHLLGFQHEHLQAFKLPPAHSDELLVIIASCFVCGFMLCFLAYRAPKSVTSAFGGVLFGVFCLNEIVPQFGHDGFLCNLVGAWVSLVGAIVGMTASLLATWAAVGVCLGCLAGIFLALADGGVLLSSPLAVSFLFAVAIGSSLAISWFKEKSCTIVMMAGTGGLLITSGVDLAVLKAHMVTVISRVLQMRMEEDRCSEDCHMTKLLVLWVTTTILGVAIQGHMSGLMPLEAVYQIFGRMPRGRHGYTHLSGRGTGTSSVGSSPSVRRSRSGSKSGGNHPGGLGRNLSGSRKTWTYSNNSNTKNYFDMNNPPYHMGSFRDAIFSAADTVANLFGFQDDNVRNQVEHVMILLSNHRRFAHETPDSLGEAFLPPKSAVHSLHRKLFMNYRDWCEAMRVVPQFMDPAQGNEIDGSTYTEEDALLTDVMLWLFMWGEAGNLRHIPECLCFLYHRMMQEFLTIDGTKFPSLYAGYFLDHVITPIYEVVTRKKKGGDHVSKLNYDDFNEFFWTPACLRHGYRSYNGIEIVGVMEEGGAFVGNTPGNLVNSKLIPIAIGLEGAPKTFLEKRSFLSTLLCFHRIVEFHVVTFQISAIIAFAQMMVWDKAYFLQMLSTVFWSINFLGIVWTSIEVWQAFPGVRITGTAKCGFLVRLCLRFLVLVYQSLYFMWSTRHNPKVDENTMQSKEDYIFWWWQYLWLSFLTMVPHMLEMGHHIFPPIATWLCVLDNDYFQAFLNICYPLSRLYVGKHVNVSVEAAAKYMFFWGTLLSWKLWFSYRFEVLVLVLPSVELYDDYVNYPNTSYWGMFFLILLRWVPQMCIFFIDTSIWFACWSAMTGTIIGFQERLGEIRDFQSIRTHFMQLPAVFCSKVICPGVSSRDPSSLDMSASAVLGSSSVESGRSFGPSAEPTLTEASRLLANMESGATNGGSTGHTREIVGQFLDLRTQKWAMFAAVWNEIINNMRHSDVINNAEQNMLKFHSFAGFGKPVYLPIFQTAGSVEVAVGLIQDHVRAYETEEDPARRGQHEIALRRKITEDVTVNEALSEVWELGVWIIRALLGPKHEDDTLRTIQVLNHFISGDKAMVYMRLQNVKAIVADATAIFSTLHHALPKRKFAPQKHDQKSRAGEEECFLPSSTPELLKSSTDDGVPSKPRGGGGMTKSISTGRLSDLGSGRSIDLGNGRAPGVSSGLATEGRRQGMVGAHVSSSTGKADKTRDAVRDKLRPLLTNLRNMIRTVEEKGTQVVGRISYMTNLHTGFMWDDTYASHCLDCLAQDKMALSILEKLYGLLSIDRNSAEPQSVEARRRLAFFANSLFTDMPRAPAMNDMMSWSCMTPFYSEDVVYSRSELEQKNEDGLTTLMYLQALYKNDWRNFMERKGITSEQQALSKKHIEATRLWASFRAQTLARTVEGMMYYEATLRLLARLECVKEEKIDELILQKFQYVVACQVFGRMKKNQDPKADDIEMLLRRFPSLRVAYIDEVRVSRENGDRSAPTMEYFSVLIKSAQDGSGGQRPVKAGGGIMSGIQEVYRVKLPGNPVFGEGKPENQNHAIMFTRGENVQAIDMNQEGYFEEALKMRCFLQEFRRGTPRCPTVILGFREHIFTGSVSSLANYMALQETSFVTLGQRVLNNPLRVRMHYGHPDVFDKVFYMTAGGVSKASKGINLSEDIFAGYNGTIRGGQVHFAEYMQVGKGRDVGMQQIYKFEAKLSQGAAEQTLSRDVNRLGDRLDFFRLMSFYFGGLGYYVGNLITVLTVTYVVYFMMALAIFRSETIGDRKLIPEGNLQMMLAGMGLLNTMPMLATLMVEKGLLRSLGEVLQVFLTGGPMYFMFHIQTRAHYFYQTILAGGAQYRATGRGFVTHHSRFDDIYRFFANSHFYLGFELMMALIVTAVMTTSKQYLGMTWSLWLACVSFLFAPFWFNPLSFHWGKVVQDYKIWMRWMNATGGSSSNSWEVWWREETSYLARFTLIQRLPVLVRPLIYVVIAYGIGGHRLLKLQDYEIRVLTKLICLALALIVISAATQRWGARLSPWVRRSSTIFITAFAVVYGIRLLLAHTKYLGVVVALYYVIAAMNTVAQLMGYKFSRFAWHMHDLIIGHLLFTVLFLLAALQFPSTVQTWLLFHNALSDGVVIDDILKYARMNKERAGIDDDGLEDEEDVKKLLRAQAAELEVLKQRVITKGDGLFASGEHGSRGKEAHPGSLSMTASTGYSYEMDEIALPGGDASRHCDISEEAEMMHASTSTLNLTELAHTRASLTSPRSLAFPFTSPMSMPPR